MTYEPPGPPPPPPPPPGPPAGSQPPPSWSPPQPQWQPQPQRTGWRAWSTAKKVVVGVVAVALGLVVLGALAGPRQRAPSASGSPAAAATPSPTETARAAGSSPTRSPAAPTDGDTAPPTTTPAGATPTATTTPVVPVGDRGIVFSQHVLFNQSGFATVGVLAQNTTDLVKSYTVKATYKRGDGIVATATGFVNDHVPASTRAVTLLLDGDPATSDAVRIDVHTMIIEAPETADSRIAALLTFGPPTFDAEPLMTYEIEVTNGSTSTVSLSVGAGVLRNGQLVALAAGFVNDLGPGQTKTATLLVTGDAKGSDELLVTANTIVAQ